MLYSSLYVGLIIVNLRGSASAGKGDFGVLLHFALVALVALGLYAAVRKGLGRLRPLAALLALAGLGCMVLPLLPGEIAGKAFNGRPPLLGMGMSLFLPVGLFLFFRTVPTGRAGFAFALVIACNELLWALLFPLLGGFSSQLPERQAFHLFSLCCWMVGGAGLCLGAAWEHEFGRQGQSHDLRPFHRRAFSARGDTGTGELGLTVRPFTDSTGVPVPLSFDLGVQGYTGKREGVTGSLQVRFEF